jgi:hypothetical protein
MEMLHAEHPAVLDKRITATPPGELREPLLELFAIVVGGRLLDLRLDLGDAGLDLGLLARAAHDGGILLFNARIGAGRTSVGRLAAQFGVRPRSELSQRCPRVHCPCPDQRQEGGAGRIQKTGTHLCCRRSSAARAFKMAPKLASGIRRFAKRSQLRPRAAAFGGAWSCVVDDPPSPSGLSSLPRFGSTCRRSSKSLKVSGGSLWSFCCSGAGAPSSNGANESVTGDRGASLTSPSRDVALSYLRLANLDNELIDRLSRYEGGLWRQTVQTLFALPALKRRYPR